MRSTSSRFSLACARQKSVAERSALATESATFKFAFRAAPVGNDRGPLALVVLGLLEAHAQQPVNRVGETTSAARRSAREVQHPVALEHQVHVVATDVQDRGRFPPPVLRAGQEHAEQAHGVGTTPLRTEACFGRQLHLVLDVTGATHCDQRYQFTGQVARKVEVSVVAADVGPAGALDLQVHHHLELPGRYRRRAHVLDHQVATGQPDGATAGQPGAPELRPGARWQFPRRSLCRLARLDRRWRRCGVGRAPCAQHLPTGAAATDLNGLHRAGPEVDPQSRGHPISRSSSPAPPPGRLALCS